MATDEQYEELRRLVAALTKRVYELEKRSGLRQSPPSKQPIPISRYRKPQPDLESQIGGHWLNRVGILAVLIGVSYFLKYAFESQWVGPAGRVVIGLMAGAYGRTRDCRSGD